MKNNKMMVINDAREFGECFVGNESFDLVKDTKAWQRFFKKNNIEDCYLYHNHNTGDWFVVCP